MAVRSIKELDIQGKRVLIRVDFNVPLDGGGSIRDDTRIRRSLDTIRYATDRGAKTVLMSHLGRPKGERKPEMSLRPVAARLGELLGKDVEFVDDCIGPEVEEAVGDMADGDVILLENLRFHAGETKNDAEFARQLAAHADVYVNDAFGTAHRAHASTVGVAEIVGERAAGLLLKDELDNLEKAFSDPKPPVVALFGGAKVSDKVGVLRNLLDKMDVILIGGGMANTFLKAQGKEIGTSKFEEESLEVAGEILKSAEESGKRIVLPLDLVVAEAMDRSARAGIVGADNVPAQEMALDIGPKSVDAFSKEIEKAGTLVWNGPMGVFEMAPFKMGTQKIAKTVSWAPGFTVVGGGDTVRAVQTFGLVDKIDYISTGGGAFMEFLEGKTLPGVAALEQ